jgi:hypothetical protein
MCEFEDELVNHTIDANRATDKLKISIRRIVENEVVPIKGRQIAPSHAASQLFKAVSKLIAHLLRIRTYSRNMIYVWFLHHSAHSVLNRPVGEFVERVLLPDVF